MSMYSSNENILRPISLALVDLFAQASEAKTTIKHLKVIYKLEDKSCMVDAKLSSQVPITEITNALMSQIDYLINSLISNYQTVYRNNYLNKVIFEADLDTLGIVYDSVKVTCVMRANLKNLDSKDLILNALVATVQAEQSELVERPVTGLKLNLKRKKLRNFALIFDYAKDPQERVYQTGFVNSLIKSLSTLIQAYCSFTERHQASISLCFNLLNRKNLQIAQGQIYPTKKLRLFNGFVLPQEAKYLIKQVDQILMLVGNSKVNGLQLIRHPNGEYISRFQIVYTADDMIAQNNVLDINLSSSQQLANILTKIIDTCSLSKDLHDWKSIINADMQLVCNEWKVKCNSYQLIHSFKDPSISFKSAKFLLNDVNNKAKGKAVINSFCLVTQHKGLRELGINLSQHINLEQHSHPMQVPTLNQFFKPKSKLYYNFALGSGGYALQSERYLGWAKS